MCRSHCCTARAKRATIKLKVSLVIHSIFTFTATRVGVNELLTSESGGGGAVEFIARLLAWAAASCREIWAKTWADGFEVPGAFCNHVLDCTVNAVTTAEKSPVCTEDISHDTLTAVPGTHNDEEVIEIVSPSVHCLLIMVFGRLQDVLPGRRILLYTCGQTR